MPSSFDFLFFSSFNSLLSIWYTVLCQITKFSLQMIDIRDGEYFI